MVNKKPFEIARETLKQLTARKLAPTPANYQSVYSEVAGVPTLPPFPADRLREGAQALPAKTPEQQRHRALLESAVGQMNWDGVKSAALAYAGFTPSSGAPGRHDAGNAIGCGERASAGAEGIGGVGRIGPGVNGRIL